MKTFPTIITVILGFFLIVPTSDARLGGGGGGGRKIGGGGGGGQKINRGGGNSGGSRSPMTGSRMKRPEPIKRPTNISRPAPQKKPISRPAPKPIERPKVNRPIERPTIKKPAPQKPIQRPSAGGNKLPDRKPVSRPETQRPDNRPSLNRPAPNRPSTLPGMVSYPNKPDRGKPASRPNLGDKNRPDLANRPGAGDRDRPNLGNRPGNDKLPGIGNNNRPGAGNNKRPDRRPSITDRDRVNIGDRNNANIRGGDRNRVHIDKVNIGRKNVGLNRPSNLPNRDRNWDSNRWGGNNSVWGNRVNIGNNVNIKIDNRFRNNNNFACRPNYWGARPWWGASNYHSWHHGHWGYGYNSSYYRRHWYYNDDNFAKGFMWGIGVWSLGNLIYDMGYQSYKNPYPAPKVENTYITYSQPVSVAAAANPPGDEEAAATAETMAAESLEASRVAFKAGDYVTALSTADKAISHTPGDVTLHEYRALCYFALGKYGESAGVLNTVLASGPGWTWDTMISFYDGSTAYNEQLEKLEAYVKSSGKAHAHFLLGYHYMVCGHLEQSYKQFAKASELEPADSISRQLAALTKDSIQDGGDDAEPEPRPDPVPADKLVGTWTSDTGNGKVTFTMTDSGAYTWAFKPTSGDASEIKGTYGLDDKGLLILTSDETQMVSAVEMKDESKMHFTLIGAPDGDPGLDFNRS